MILFPLQKTSDRIDIVNVTTNNRKIETVYTRKFVKIARFLLRWTISRGGKIEIFFADLGMEGKKSREKSITWPSTYWENKASTRGVDAWPGYLGWPSWLV